MLDNHVCGAHDIFLSTVERIQTVQDKISDEVGENNVRTATLCIQFTALSEQFSSYREENERHQHALLVAIQGEKTRHKWRPVHFVALLTALMTALGVMGGAWISKGGIKP